jgi:carbamoyltransferase
VESAITPVYILGVNPGPHDGSAVLLRDGDLVVMAEQERYSRRRHAIGEPPTQAVQACLAHEGIGLDAVGCLSVGWDLPALAEVEDKPFAEQDFLDWLLADVPAPRRAAPTVHYVDHHRAHAASAFYTSGLTEAAIIVADGRGESISTSVAVGSPDGIEVIRTWGTEQSLGHFYGWAVDWAGLGMWGTGKLMGLAAYGRPVQPVTLHGSGDGYVISDCAMGTAPVRYHFALMRSRLRAGFRRRNFPFTEGNPSDVMAYADFAASVQGALEDAVLGLARYARQVTRLKSLVFAGGVALNCSANGRLIRSGIFDEVWIPPFPDDAGVAVGAALATDREFGAGRRPPARLSHAFWMPHALAPADLLAETIPGVTIEQFRDDGLPAAVADHLARGDVVAWWQGRAEVGPRALGARSILCDPRRRDAHSVVNNIKGREAWRPLAPAVLSEQARQVFDGDLPAAADFMLAAWPVRAPAIRQFPAAVHVDGSTRPQIVHPGPGRYRAVLEAFQERSGVPLVINTSFNIDGEPMVLTAEDALRTFLGSRAHVLVLDDVVIRRSPAAVAAAPRHQLHAFSFIPWAHQQPSFAAVAGGGQDRE